MGGKASWNNSNFDLVFPMDDFPKTDLQISHNLLLIVTQFLPTPLFDNTWLAFCALGLFPIYNFINLDGFPQGEKITNAGHLNEFTACSNSPLPQIQYCQAHMDEGTGDTVERLDTGVMTRARSKELGLDLEELTTSEGCRFFIH